MNSKSPKILKESPQQQSQHNREDNRTANDEENPNLQTHTINTRRENINIYIYIYIWDILSDRKRRENIGDNRQFRVFFSFSFVFLFSKKSILLTLQNIFTIPINHTFTQATFYVQSQIKIFISLYFLKFFLFFLKINKNYY